MRAWVVAAGLIEGPAGLVLVQNRRRDGSLDWMCLPHFDSPACFAALLDTPDAGRWLLAPAGGGTCTSRSYDGDSLVLQTDWQSATG